MKQISILVFICLLTYSRSDLKEMRNSIARQLQFTTQDYNEIIGKIRKLEEKKVKNMNRLALLSKEDEVLKDIIKDQKTKTSGIERSVSSRENSEEYRQIFENYDSSLTEYIKFLGQFLKPVNLQEQTTFGLKIESLLKMIDERASLFNEYQNIPARGKLKKLNAKVIEKAIEQATNSNNEILLDQLFERFAEVEDAVISNGYEDKAEELSEQLDGINGKISKQVAELDEIFAANSRKLFGNKWQNVAEAKKKWVSVWAELLVSSENNIQAEFLLLELTAERSIEISHGKENVDTKKLTNILKELPKFEEQANWQKKNYDSYVSYYNENKKDALNSVSQLKMIFLRGRPTPEDAKTIEFLENLEKLSKYRSEMEVELLGLQEKQMRYFLGHSLLLNVDIRKRKNDKEADKNQVDYIDKEIDNLEKKKEKCANTIKTSLRLLEEYDNQLLVEYANEAAIRQAQEELNGTKN